LQWDQDAFVFLNNLGSANWDWFWLFITHKFASIPLYAFILFLLFRYWGWKNTLTILVLIAAMITCTDQLANVFKDGFQRLRPCHHDFLNARFIDSCGKYGFFSAHACSSFALAIYLGNILRERYKFALLAMVFWALVVSYSRIYVGVHYPGDVITGALIGIIIGFIFFYLQNYLRSRFEFKQKSRSV